MDPCGAAEIYGDGVETGAHPYPCCLQHGFFLRPGREECARALLARQGAVGDLFLAAKESGDDLFSVGEGADFLDIHADGAALPNGEGGDVGAMRYAEMQIERSIACGERGLAARGESERDIGGSIDAVSFEQQSKDGAGEDEGRTGFGNRHSGGTLPFLTVEQLKKMRESRKQGIETNRWPVPFRPRMRSSPNFPADRTQMGGSPRDQRYSSCRYTAAGSSPVSAKIARSNRNVASGSRESR